MLRRESDAFVVRDKRAVNRGTRADVILVLRLLCSAKGPCTDYRSPKTREADQA